MKKPSNSPSAPSGSLRRAEVTNSGAKCSTVGARTACPAVVERKIHQRVDVTARERLGASNVELPRPPAGGSAFDPHGAGTGGRAS